MNSTGAGIQAQPACCTAMLYGSLAARQKIVALLTADGYAGEGTKT
jgi:hypothetical protein